MKRAMTFLAGSAFGLALVSTCGSKQAAILANDLGHAAGDLLGVDMSDAIDIGIKDAAASPPMSADCSKTWSYSVDGSGQTMYYAEFAVSGYDPTMPDHVTAWICEPTIYDGTGNGSLVNATIVDDGAGGCGTGFLCDPSPMPVNNCASAYGLEGAVGVVRVRCGSRSTSNNAQAAGVVYAKAYLKVGQ